MPFSGGHALEIVVKQNAEMSLLPINYNSLFFSFLATVDIVYTFYKSFLPLSTYGSRGRLVASPDIATPSPCTASSEAFSVKAFGWRIRDKTSSDHVTRNALTAQINEA